MPCRRHLRRLERVVPLASPVWFITICTAGRRRILAEPQAAALVRDALHRTARMAGWRVGGFVVMPDHLHFFAAPVDPREADLSDMVGRVKRWTARGLRGLGHASPIWQAEFFDHLLRTSESFTRKWLYLRENPVRAGLVERPEDWPYQGEIDPWVSAAMGGVR
jgi:putative transposase